MIELLSPAGSPETVVAAVQNGANAVYMGFGNFNARRNAKNFTEKEFRDAVDYCHIRGVKTYVTLNTLVSDRELPAVAEAAKQACRFGADAILVQDLGVLQAVRQSVPEMPIHASTQMSLHSLDGVRMAAAMGMTRVVLSRELSLEEIRYICQNSPVEIEVFAHGALCMCYSGQCYMSAVIGRRSGNRGLCAQPCRQEYGGGSKTNYPLSLKDNCLVQHIQELESAGVACLKIEGRMKRPEYSAIVTGIYSRAIREGKRPSPQDMEDLAIAFSRQGFTDGYYKDAKGASMFGVRQSDESDSRSLFDAARKAYLHSEVQQVPVQFVASVSPNEPAKLVARDDSGHYALAQGPVPEPAVNKEITATTLQTQLYKTGGTPFYCDGVKSSVAPGLSLPVSAINEMRRSILTDLANLRRAVPQRKEGTFIPALPCEKRTQPPVLTVSVAVMNQLSPQLAELAPRMVIVPLASLSGNESKLTPFMKNSNITLCASIPRIIHDHEVPQIQELLDRAFKLGIRDAMVGNLGHIVLAKKAGMTVHGDFGLNIYNSDALNVVKALGLHSAALSFEARLEQIRDISKCIPTELIVYGRLPLMITENCLIKNAVGTCSCDRFSGITDKAGFQFPVLREFGCRNAVYNSKKLFLADKSQDYTSLGLWGARLMFTTENADECVQVVRSYMGQGGYAPSGVTRGLYYRGVE